VLRDITSIISGANISAQTLETAADIGCVCNEGFGADDGTFATLCRLTLHMPACACSYMVVDLESTMLGEVHKKLEEMSHNIRLRIIFEGEGYVAHEPSL